MAVQQRQWGTTPSISWTLPTEKEILQNEELTEELKRQGQYEASGETEKKQQLLVQLQKIAIEFVKHVCRKNNLPQSIVDSAGGKVFTYGSYRLGAYAPGSDIDTLVVAPRHVTREDFFEHMPSILERMLPLGAIEEMKPVPEAYVPIIKLMVHGTDIDLNFTRLAVSSVPWDLDVKDTNLLRGLDDRELRALNGPRVADELLQLVPQKKTFRTALRAIKLWAQRRAVYGNIVGFPGGVAWGMLVARVCQLYPQATGSVIVMKFFRIIGRWNWPQPILLKESEDHPIQARVWNPRLYPTDKYHLMPIITPAYPAMCATHNIGPTTKKIIIQELERGGDITDKISFGRLQWKDLFQKHTYFTRDYKYYLSIISGSTSKEAQASWSGFVESKVRLLVQSLEGQGSIGVARLFNKGFAREHRCKDENEIEAVLHGDMQYQATNVKTETTDKINDPRHNAIAEGNVDAATIANGDGETAQNGNSPHAFYTTTYYIGIELAQDSTKKLDVSEQSRDWKEQQCRTANFEDGRNYLNIAATRSYDLPLDVFGAGEERPTKIKKKAPIKKASVTTHGQKRNLSASGMEDLSSTVNDMKRPRPEDTRLSSG
ncbi:MAG: hypothetical protein L6R41_001631 [Letrouitia leprolyta]|nr:MAG: hypothetical protein L6R41_001631 [Letrouitia leprolyta]